jgi:chemotaxis signal transduction protein
VAAFIEPSGHVLCASGTLPTLPKKLLALAKGETWAGVLVEDGQCYTVGAAAGSGYREFKNSDGHTEVVIGVVVVPCGAVAQEAQRQSTQLQPVPGGEEVATFLIGGHLMGIEAAEVVECIEVPKAVRLPRQADAVHRHVGITTFEERAIALLDLSADMGEMAREHRHAIVLRHQGLTFGLLVSELGSIVELEFVERPGLIAAAGAGRLVTRLARCGSALVPVLSAASVLGAAGAELQQAMLESTSGDTPPA